MEATSLSNPLLVPFTPLLTLPVEMLSKIFQELINHRDFCRFSRANRRLLQVSELPTSWYGLTWRIEQTLFSSAPLKEVFRKKGWGKTLGDYLIYTVSGCLEVYHLKTGEIKPIKGVCSYFEVIQGAFPALATLTDDSHLKIWNLNQVMQEEAPQPILEKNCSQVPKHLLYFKAHRHFFCATVDLDVLVLDLSSQPVRSFKASPPTHWSSNYVYFSENYLLVGNSWNGHYAVYELEAALMNEQKPEPVASYEPDQMLAIIHFSDDKVTLKVLDSVDQVEIEEIQEIDWRSGMILRQWPRSQLPRHLSFFFENAIQFFSFSDNDGLNEVVNEGFRQGLHEVNVIYHQRGEKNFPIRTDALFQNVLRMAPQRSALLDRNTLEEVHVRPFANAIVSSDLLRNFLVTNEKDDQGVFTFALYDLAPKKQE